jgi:predicted ATPase
LHALSASLERTLEDLRQVVFITGETGIGKTTLADECMRRAAAEIPGIRIARGQCVEGHGGREAYYPILEAIGALCRAPGGATLVRTLAAQAPTWLVRFPDLMTSEHREQLRPELLVTARDCMLREIVEAFETFSAEAPLLLVLEDLHWADSFTVDFISTLARRRAAGRLMLVGTFRPLDMALVQHPLRMVKQDLLVHQLCREIALKPLTEDEVAEYLALEMPGIWLPDELPALIYRHSEGNPLLMVATLDHLRTRDLIGLEDGRCCFLVPPERIQLETPESLRQLIELQIEGLTAEQQHVLEIASISGRSFIADESAIGTSVDPETFERVCAELARRQHMVRRTGPSQLTRGAVSQGYEFAHAVYRDVFYRRQPPSRRATLQGRAGAEARDTSLQSAACP